MLWEWAAREGLRQWVGGAVCVAVRVHSLGRGCQHVIRVAVKGRIGGWVLWASTAQCVIVWGPPWESGGVIWQAGAGVLQLFQRGLSCLSPHEGLAWALPASPWPGAKRLKQAVHLGVQAVGPPLLELTCVRQDKNRGGP